jgi:hypothetical protein
MRAIIFQATSDILQVAMISQEIVTAAWCCRILLEASPELNRLPQLWLTHMLDHMQRPGQSRDDIVRRSAGLPAAFVALFTAEPTGHPKTLLYTGIMP